MKPVRLLIVEDERDLLVRLAELYRAKFEELGFGPVEIEEASSVAGARERAREARGRPYDLVSLDVNLNDPEVTGLDVLATLSRYQSAWMVALLTGVEGDATLDGTLGDAKAEELRKTLRQRADERFPAERLRVVEKPSSRLPKAEADRLLADRVGQIALLYEGISRSRFIFRPIEKTSEQRVAVPAADGKGRATSRFVKTVSLKWQIRYDCGDLDALPDRAGMRTLHRLLSLPRGESLTPEEALVIEPKHEREGPGASGQSGQSGASVDRDPLAEFFEAQGIAWSDLRDEEQEKLIAAALSLRIRRYVELREYQDDDDLSAEEEDELGRLVAEFGPLAATAESAYRRLRDDAEAEPDTVASAVGIGVAAAEGLHPEGGHYERGPGRRGQDSKAAAGFRKRMERVRDYLRENGFADLARHLEHHLSSTGANWSYHPPEGVEWTTR